MLAGTGRKKKFPTLEALLYFEKSFILQFRIWKEKVPKESKIKQEHFFDD